MKFHYPDVIHKGVKGVEVEDQVLCSLATIPEDTHFWIFEVSKYIRFDFATEIVSTTKVSSVVIGVSSYMK